MITENFCIFWQPNIQLDDMDLEHMWFQQDGAISHTANVRINLLETKFGERVISRDCPVSWPPRSCNLKPLDYFLWGYVKSMVYANKPATIDELRTNIERDCSSIGRFMLENRQKLGSGSGLRRACGNYVKEIEFHS